MRYNMLKLIFICAVTLLVTCSCQYLSSHPALEKALEQDGEKLAVDAIEAAI